MKINLRWIVQALAYVGAIWAFVQLWDLSKLALITGIGGVLPKALLFVAAFSFCFFVLFVTSYLKQRQNGTLKNRIALFERLLNVLRLT